MRALKHAARIKFAVNPSAIAHIANFGAAVTPQMGGIYIDISGRAAATSFNGDTTAGAAQASRGLRRSLRWPSCTFGKASSATLLPMYLAVLYPSAHHVSARRNAHREHDRQ